MRIYFVQDVWQFRVQNIDNLYAAIVQAAGKGVYSGVLEFGFKFYSKRNIEQEIEHNICV